MAFRHSTRQQPTTSGLDNTIHVLESDAGDRAEVWPALGFNCFSWKTVKGGQALDLLYADPGLFDNGRPTRSGIPILFPFPNRIRDGQCNWEGRPFALPKIDGTKKNAIHGFVCRKPWRLVEEGSDADSAWITGEFQLSRDDADSLPLWPADFVLKVTYRLLAGRLRVESQVRNPGAGTLPFGIGYHPYFTVPFVPGAKADDCLIQVPAASYWKLDETLPTGEILPVDEARDFRKPRPFGGVNVDDVLTNLTSGGPETPAGLRWNGSMIQGERKLHFFSSTFFRELVVFTPPNRKAFCLEPYTCPTNAINMPNQGKDVGWLTLPSGAKWNAEFEMATE